MQKTEEEMENALKKSNLAAQLFDLLKSVKTKSLNAKVTELFQILNNQNGFSREDLDYISFEAKRIDLKDQLIDITLAVTHSEKTEEMEGEISALALALQTVSAKNATFQDLYQVELFLHEIQPI